MHSTPRPLPLILGIVLGIVAVTAPVATYSVQALNDDARKAFDEANALFAKTENDKALAAYDTAIALDPKQPDYHVGRCRTLARLMRHAEGIASCSNALKLDPGHAAALLERGHFLINIRQAEKAIPDLIRARQLGADASGVGYHLSLAYYVTGDFKQAADQYDHCHANARTDDNRVACTAWQYLALVRAERQADADKVLERVTPDTKVQSSAAYLDRLLLFKGARTEEEVAAAMQKDNLQLATVAYGLGVWHLVNGRQGRARAYFEKATAPPAQQSGFGSVAAYYELQRMK
jgi:tetratricopeptide (TPR) repeat protein